MVKTKRKHEIKEDLDGNDFSQLKEEINKDVKTLFLKKQKLFKDVEHLVTLKEPVLFLMRNSGDIEIHENVKGTTFNFENGDGNASMIKINPTKLHRMNYGQHLFKCYVAHENNALCYPQKSIYDTEEINEIFNKAQRDLQNRKIAQYSQYGEAISKAVIGIGIAVAIYLFAKWAFPSSDSVTPEVASNVTKIVQNATILK